MKCRISSTPKREHTSSTPKREHTSSTPKRERQLTYDLKASANNSLLPNVNFMGFDLRALHADNVSMCSKACSLRPKCHAFTFITQTISSSKHACWLKKAGYEEGADYSEATVSGAKITSLEQVIARRTSRPVSSLLPNNTLLEQCRRDGPTSWSVLAVPKSASVSLAFSFGWSNKDKRCKIKKPHFHQTTYHSDWGTPCALSTLREPCDRALSIYHFLKKQYTSHGECRGEKAAVCRSHWVHQAANFDEFVPLLKVHWSSVLGHIIVTRGISRHLVLAMPQFLWIGQATRVLCTNRFSAEVNATAHDLGCGGSIVAEHKNAAAGSSHEVIRNMSPTTCQAVKALYWQDDYLFRRLCVRGATLQHTTQA